MKSGLIKKSVITRGPLNRRSVITRLHCSAYPLRPWLLTPIENAGGQAEERYNRSHRVTRQCIGGAFGIWKMRWLVIHDFGVAMTLRLAVCLRVIVASAVLHNICQLNGVPLPPDAPPNHGDNPDDDNNPLHVISNTTGSAPETR